MTPDASAARARRRCARLAAAATLGLLLAPAAAQAAIPLDLAAYADRALTFHGASSARPAGELWTGELAGASVAGDCDVDGDGTPDLIVGAPMATVGALADAGRVYVVSGGTRAAGDYGLPTEAGDPVDAGTIKIEGEAATQGLGTTVACAGDVDRDGADDVAIGISTSAAAVNRSGYVVFGGAALRSAGTVDVGALGAHGFAASLGTGTRRPITFVAGVGDVDRDGYDDVAFGVHQQAVSGVTGGSVSIVRGRTATTPVDLTASDDVLLRVTGAASDQLDRVAVVGDQGGGAGGALDEVPDLLIGAPAHDGPNGSNSGAAFVVSGAARGDVTIRGWATDANVLRSIWGPAADAQIGVVAAAGDVDGDSRPDLAIGQRAAGLLTDGDRQHRSAWVVYGTSPSAVGATARVDALGDDGYTIRGLNFVNAADSFGSALAPLGDLDRDGRSDLAIGAPGLEGPEGSSTGAVYLVYGRDEAEGDLAAGALTCEQGARLYGERRITGLGAGVANAGAFVGGGAPQLLIGAATARESNGNFARVIPLESVPGACGDEREPTADLDLDFGFRENFRGYVFRGFDAANPAVPIAASAGATCDVNPDPVRGGCDPRGKTPTDPYGRRALRWTPVGAGATDGSDTTIATIGMVTFRFPAHFFVLRVRDPWVVISGGTATVRARVTLDVTDGFGGARPADVRVDLGTYPLAGAPVRAGQFVQWRTEPGTLTDEAWAALGGSFLGRGAELDPITLAVPRSLGALPEEPTVPRVDPPREDPPRQDPPRQDPPGTDPPRVPVATFTAGVRSATVRRATTLKLGTVACRVQRCHVTATSAIRVRVGRDKRGRARFVVLKVSAPATLARGRRGELRLRVSRAAAKALAGRSVRVKVKIGVSGDGRPLAKTVTVSLRGARPSSTARRR